MSSILNHAVQAGVVSKIDCSPSFSKWSPPRIKPQVRDALARIKPGPARRLERRFEQLDDPARDTKAQLYQDAGFEWIRGETNPFEDDIVLEIARFIATPGQAGVVKYCGTYAELESSSEPFYISLDPRDPYALFRRNVKIQWILRLYQGTFQSLGPPYRGPYNTVHGYGFNPLPFWTDYRFQWGRTANDVWWLVPENHALRLYARIDTGSDSLSAMIGRLVGFTQPIRVVQTGWNVRHGW